jgi:hypothetical protein
VKNWFQAFAFEWVKLYRYITAPMMDQDILRDAAETAVAGLYKSVKFSCDP